MHVVAAMEAPPSACREAKGNPGFQVLVFFREFFRLGEAASGPPERPVVLCLWFTVVAPCCSWSITKPEFCHAARRVPVAGCIPLVRAVKIRLGE
jgi:hypothetical protein